jgi:quinolinate synthase
MNDILGTLKKERNAVILAHNYEEAAVQDIADFVGDSLELSRKAAQTDAEVIVFCGVRFMAETAKILAPDRTVLLPVAGAGCPMADMITASALQQLTDAHPDATVVCYVNTSAEVKAHSDICCTSSNAVEVVQNACPEDREVIFIPDKNLAANTARVLGRSFIVWQGYCPVHAAMTLQDLSRMRQQHPDALVMVHPECDPAVCERADAVVSTGGMCRYARENRASEIIVGTEVGMLYRLQKENPRTRFYSLSDRAICADMKRIGPESVISSLKENRHEITLSDEVIHNARKSITRMLDIR